MESMGGFTGYYILAGILFLIGSVVSGRLKSKFKKYSQVPLMNGMTGRDVALKMLQDNNVQGVQVMSSQGFLSDHYNPANKTVNLSHDVYAGNSVAAAAVAAHECGHAIQHATAYPMLQFRSKMVPAVNISTRLSQILIIAGLGMMIGAGTMPWLFWAGIALFAITTLFTLVTLPVEYDASNRALAWLHRYQVLNPREHEQAKDALKWAARTYVVAAISSVATLIYYIMMFAGRSRD